MTNADVSLFATAIQRRLNAHAWKGDTWRTVPVEDLWAGLLREVDEARAAHAADDPSSELHEWADVAAYALFLWARACEAAVLPKGASP